MWQSGDLKILTLWRCPSRIVNFAIVQTDQNPFNSIFLVNRCQRFSRLLENNITKVLAIHLLSCWELIQRESAVSTENKAKH
jgi:hypothetical protein